MTQFTQINMTLIIPYNLKAFFKMQTIPSIYKCPQIDLSLQVVNLHIKQNKNNLKLEP